MQWYEFIILDGYYGEYMSIMFDSYGNFNEFYYDIY